MASLAVEVVAEEWDDLVVDEVLLRLVGVAPDEHDQPDGEQRGPTDEADVRHVQGARDHLQKDQQRNQDGEDEADPLLVLDGPRVDVARLPVHRDHEPGQGVDEDHDPAGDARQDAPDAHPSDVDTGGPRDRTAHATQHPVVLGAAEGPEPAPDVRWHVMTVVRPLGTAPVAAGSVALGRRTVGLGQRRLGRCRGRDG